LNEVLNRIVFEVSSINIGSEKKKTTKSRKYLTLTSFLMGGGKKKQQSQALIPLGGVSYMKPLYPMLCSSPPRFLSSSSSLATNSPFHPLVS